MSAEESHAISWILPKSPLNKRFFGFAVNAQECRPRLRAALTGLSELTLIIGMLSCTIMMDLGG